MVEKFILLSQLEQNIPGDQNAQPCFMNWVYKILNCSVVIKMCVKKPRYMTSSQNHCGYKFFLSVDLESVLFLSRCSGEYLTGNVLLFHRCSHTYY